MVRDGDVAVRQQRHTHWVLKLLRTVTLLRDAMCSDGSYEGAVDWIHDLKTVIRLVGDDDVAVRQHGNTNGTIELVRGRTGTAPNGPHEGPVGGVHDLKPMVE